MKKLFCIALFMVASVAVASADTPTYRASFTATGANPTVTITPQTGDAILVFTLSDGHASTDLGAHTATDNASGTYWDQYCGAVWKHGSKFAKMDVLVRGQLTGSSSFNISVNTGGKSAAVVAVAVSGLTAINNYPASVNGCGTLNPGSPNGTPGSVRQVKNNGYCANCSTNPIVAGSTPSVPTFGQTNAFLSTSMTFAVFANEQQTPSPSAPSGWTTQATAGVGGAKAFGLSVSTRDSGYTGSTITWGSTTPTDGNALAVELQPIQ